MTSLNWHFLSSSNYPTGSRNITPVTGFLVLHQDLRNPFLGDGVPTSTDWCKQHSIGSATSEVISLAHLSPAISGGLFDINERKAVSVRALLRLSQSTPAVVKDGAIGLCVKTGYLHDNASSFAKPSVNLFTHPSGYSAVLGPIFNTSGVTSSLWFELFSAKMGGGGTGDSSSSFRYNVTGGFSHNVWHRIRMDVIPISQSTDIVRIFVGTGSTRQRNLDTSF